MERAQFRIDLLKPGQNLAPVKAWMLLLERLDGFYQLFVKRLYRRVSTSVTVLTISFVLTLLGGIFFYSQVYLVRERMLESKSKEIARLQKQVAGIKRKLKAHRARQQAREARIAQLKELKQVSIPWRDKLAGLQRSVVDGVWLNSLTVEDGGRPIKVSLQGSSLAGGPGGRRPLHLIADFISTLVADPGWQKNFALKDWHISSASEKAVSFEVVLEGK